MGRCKHGQTIATSDDLLEIIRILAQKIDRWFIVIDAVDECKDPDELVPELNKTLQSLPAKVIFFSRPNVRILRRRMSSNRTITVSPSFLNPYLTCYFDFHIERLQEFGVLPDDACKDDLVNHLLIGADGMFQWARLMILHLQSEALMPQEKVELIKGFQSSEKIDDMYVRILKSLTKKLSSEQRLAKQIFLWLVFGKKDVTEDQLQDIVKTRKKGKLNEPKQLCPQTRKEEFSSFEDNIVMVSGSLVHKRRAGSELPRYCFIHASVMEFFRARCNGRGASWCDDTGSIGFFLPTRFQAESELATLSLEYIMCRVPQSPLSGNMFQPTSETCLAEKVPFLEYAAVYWPRHLKEVIAPVRKVSRNHLEDFYSIIEGVLKVLCDFLSKKLLLMVSVESTYTFRSNGINQTDIHFLLLQWAKWMNHLDKTRLGCADFGAVTAVAAFSHDLSKMHKLWGNTLIGGPHHIWNDITAFTSSPFLVQTAAATVNYLETRRLNSSEGFNQSTMPLSKISRDDPRAEHLAVLTISPSG